MSDQENFEKWQEEHKNLLLSTNVWCLANFQELDGTYYDWHLQASWEGFLMAKRNMPVIELPDPNDFSRVGDYFKSIKYHMELSGIQYTIKGE
jgi:hypothetical protein